MKFISTLAFLFFQFQIVQVIAQVSADSLKQIMSASNDDEELMKAWNQFAFQQYTVQTDTAIYYATKALAIAIKKQDQNELQAGYNVLGLSYQVKGLFNISIDNFKKALLYNNSDHSDMGRVNHNLTLTYKTMKKNGDALKSELEAIKYAELANDSLLMSTIYQTMGNIYRDLGEYDEAESYMLKALTITDALKKFGTNNKNSVIANMYIDYGNLLQVSGRYKEAIEMHERSIIMLDDAGDIYNKAIAYENLGDDYIKLEQFDKAIENYTIAKELMQKVESLTDVGYEFYKIAQAYNFSGDNVNALFNADKAIELFQQNKADLYLMEVYQLKYAIYDKQNNSVEALSNYKKYNNLKDSLDLVAQQNELIRLKAEYETIQKEQHIVLLEAQNKQQILQRNIAVGLIGLLLVFGVMIRNRFRIRQQVKQLQMRNNIAMDLHDEVGSSLSAIKMLSEIASGSHENKIKTKEVLDKIVINASETAEKMHDIIWMINPKQDLMENIIDRMEHHLIDMCAPKQIKFEFEKKYDDDLKLTMHERKNILLIFKEAINNVIKYGESNLISVQFNYIDKGFELIVRDNGKGFEVNATRYGNGLLSMQQRSKELNASLQVVSEPGKGTMIRVASNKK